MREAAWRPLSMVAYGAVMPGQDQGANPIQLGCPTRPNGLVVVSGPGREGVRPETPRQQKKRPALRGVFVRELKRSALHRTEELVVGLGGLHLVQQELHRADLVHAVQQLA